MRHKGSLTPKLKKFYDSKAWHAVRTQVRIEHHGVCDMCGCSASHVHHIIPLDDNNVSDCTVSLNPENLMLLCISCHNKVHSTNGSVRNDLMFDKDGNAILKANVLADNGNLFNEY